MVVLVVERTIRAHEADETTGVPSHLSNVAVRVSTHVEAGGRPIVDRR
jgi:hypothetical protein